MGWGCRAREASYRLPSEFDEVFRAGVVWCGVVLSSPVRGVRGGVPPSPDRPRPRVTWQGASPTRTCSRGAERAAGCLRRLACLCLSPSHHAHNRGPDFAGGSFAARQLSCERSTHQGPDLHPHPSMIPVRCWWTRLSVGEGSGSALRDVLCFFLFEEGLILGSRGRGAARAGAAVGGAPGGAGGRAGR